MTEDIKKFESGGEIDFQSGLARVANMEKAYLRILGVAWKEGRKKLPLIREYYEAGDIESYVIEVHGLKSGMAGIGAIKLSEKAKEHEFAGKANDTGFIAEHIEDLLENYERVLKEIEQKLQKEGLMEATPKNDSVKQKERLLAAKKALEEYDSETACEQLEEVMRQRKDKEKIEAILQHTEQLEYDEALEILEELIKQC